MPKQPLVRWNEEARRLSVLERRLGAKRGQDLTVILKDTRLETVYERLPRLRSVRDEALKNSQPTITHSDAFQLPATRWHIMRTNKNSIKTTRQITERTGSISLQGQDHRGRIRVRG